MAARRPGRRVGPVGAPPRAPCRALPRRQLPAPADGARGGEPDPPGPPAPDELVPLPRAGLAAVPALPEPALHDLGSRSARCSTPTPCSAGRCTCCSRCGRSPCTGAAACSAWAAGRPPSAAAVSPFLASAAGIGYETKAYVWVGYGVWTQLWAAWTLPLAWGFTYRALSSLRAVLPAVFFIMLTVALHFETGYLAFVPLVVWPFLVPSDLWRRLGRALAVGVARTARLGLGHRAAARPVPLGGAQPGARRHGSGERLRRPPDAVVALHRPASTTPGAGRS